MRWMKPAGTKPAVGRRLQRGDTIVEVLICVAIVSLVLGGAYATARRSSQGIRNSQEHAEALKLVQAQLEQIKSSAAEETPQVFTTSLGTFCMADGQPVGSADPKCAQNAAGQPSTAQPSYRMTVTRQNDSGAFKFEVRASWDSITGNPAQETIYYRLHP